MRRIFAGTIFLIFSGVQSDGAVPEPNYPPLCSQKDKSFHAFFLRFKDDAAFQESRIIWPLVHREGPVQSGNQNVALWSRETVRSLNYPLVYSSAQLKALFLKETIEGILTGQHAEVFVQNAGEADDTRVLFRFRNVENCWYLEEVDDRGL